MMAMTAAMAMRTRKGEKTLKKKIKKDYSVSFIHGAATRL
jgi:hypothetical protein